ncbi:MFS transporter [Pseudomonas sp. PA1(2017)]|nr:MFS transporter [Pseudomonas sp. PA1(2017)]
MAICSETSRTRAAENSWPAVIAVGLATFAVVTTEMLPVGLLTSIAAALQTTNGTAGLMISLPALLAAAFAALVVIASGSIDRRKILCGLLVLLLIANIASALAPNMTWMLAARALVGFCMGGIWAIAGGLAARLVQANAIGLATSIIFGGVSAASVLGVPLGAIVGEHLGWRWAFALMALLSGSILVLHLVVIPALPVIGSTTARQFVEQFGNPKLQTGLLLTVLLVAGHFLAFTFVQPLLLDVSGLDARWIGTLLFVYGAAGLAGNFLGGTNATSNTTLTLVVIAAGLALTSVIFLSLGHKPSAGVIALLLWGLAYGAVSVSLMTLMMKAAPQAIETASALYVGTFNIAIALGSWMGGQLIDTTGLTGNLWVFGALATAALLLSLRLHRTENAP